MFHENNENDFHSYQLKRKLRNDSTVVSHNEQIDLKLIVRFLKNWDFLCFHDWTSNCEHKPERLFRNIQKYRLINHRKIHLFSTNYVCLVKMLKYVIGFDILMALPYWRTRCWGSVQDLSYGSWVTESWITFAAFFAFSRGRIRSTNLFLRGTYFENK